MFFDMCLKFNLRPRKKKNFVHILLWYQTLRQSWSCGLVRFVLPFKLRNLHSRSFMNFSRALRDCWRHVRSTKDQSLFPTYFFSLSSRFITNSRFLLWWLFHKNDEWCRSIRLQPLPNNMKEGKKMKHNRICTTMERNLLTYKAV